ncbi:hypothetical protein EL26_15470 [Tumebacillus flagellatus]|uniref:Uncharacterized protein n=1 Tax=Tumebacillus flagellatus TaxID=1157490 RepID=A0A074LJY1_9BACL|nr:hypothetical protein EL26_15470 [Tumebacillus flagellatus]
MFGITMPITKHKVQVRDAADLPRILREAYHIAGSGRPGPVLIDLPNDVSTQLAVFHDSSSSPCAATTHAEGMEIPFSVDPYRRHLLLEGLDDIGACGSHRCLRTAAGVNIVEFEHVGINVNVSTHFKNRGQPLFFFVAKCDMIREVQKSVLQLAGGRTFPNQRRSSDGSS